MTRATTARAKPTDRRPTIRMAPTMTASPEATGMMVSGPKYIIHPPFVLKDLGVQEHDCIDAHIWEAVPVASGWYVRPTMSTGQREM